MSINLGQRAHLAIQKLAGNPDFKELIAAVGEVAAHAVHASIKSEPGYRLDATAHARGFHDTWTALAAASGDVRQQVVKPLPPKAPEGKGA